MAKKRPSITKNQSDTTAIKTPYKVSEKELYKNTKVTRTGSGVMERPQADSTVKKVVYNMNDVEKSRMKRNVERVKEGKAPITKDQVLGTGRKDVRESKKGRNYKK